LCGIGIALIAFLKLVNKFFIRSTWKKFYRLRDELGPSTT
jgi:hypothetical protein